MTFRTILVALGSVVLLLGACSGEETVPSTTASSLGGQSSTTTAAGLPTEETDPTTEPAAGDELFPDVLAVVVTGSEPGSFTFDVTMSSPYDSSDRYADAWRVMDDAGAVYGIRELLHDHGNEQPFTRSLSGVEIPDGVAIVTVQGRDQVNGWGGATIQVEIPHG